MSPRGRTPADAAKKATAAAKRSRRAARRVFAAYERAASVYAEPVPWPLEREPEVSAGDAARNANTSRRAARKARRLLGEIETPKDVWDESDQYAVSSADESVQYAEEWALDALISVKALEAAAAARGAAGACQAG